MTLDESSRADPWQGANKDKQKHPRIGRFVDNIWTILFSRIVTPSALIAIAYNVWNWGDAKINLLNDIGKSVPEINITLKDIGHKLDAEVNGQNVVVEHVKALEKENASIQTKLANDEAAIAATKTDAAATNAKVDDIKEDLKDIKGLVNENLVVTKGHDADIKATRNAVAPKVEYH